MFGRQRQLDETRRALIRANAGLTDQLAHNISIMSTLIDRADEAMVAYRAGDAASLCRALDDYAAVRMEHVREVAR